MSTIRCVTTIVLIPGLFCALALTTSGCGGHKAVNSSMSAEEEKMLNESLAKLDATLKEKAPFIHAKLAPGATEDQLAELRAGLNGAQVQSLETWFRWHNGCTDVGVDILPLGRMLSISEALQDRKGIQSVPFVSARRKNAIKILDDGAGDGFFIDAGSPNPTVFHAMLEDPGNRECGTLQEFVEFITRLHAAGLASQRENGMVDFGDKGLDMLLEYFEQHQ